MVKRQDGISLIIFKQLADDFRSQYPQFDIKAHPVNDTSAVLIFKNTSDKYTFQLFAGNLDKIFALAKILSIVHVKQWVAKHSILSKISADNTSKYILMVDIISGNKLAKSEHPLPIGIDLAEPDSINTIQDWIYNIVQ